MEDQDSSDSSPPKGRSSQPPSIAPPPLPIEYAPRTAPPLPPRDGKSGLENPRNVQSMKDILHYATKMTAENPGATQAKLDEENMKFLSSALSSMTVNVSEEINNSINTLLDTEKKEIELMYAFDILDEFVDNIDFANDFQNLGGFRTFTPCLMSKYSSVRKRTAELIAVVVQNNPHCQEKFIEEPTYVRLLINLVDEESDPSVRVKCLYAISCLVRHNIDVFWKFIKLGGDGLILRALKSDTDSKVLIKATFLVLTTCSMDVAVSELYINIGVVDILCRIILDLPRRVDPVHHELFLETLCQFFVLSPKRAKEICAKFDDLKTFLPTLKTSYLNDAVYEDAQEQIDALMLHLEQ